MNSIKSFEAADLQSFRSMVLLACESALRDYKHHPSREAYVAAKGTLHGVFLGVMGTAHALQSDFWQSDLMRVAHEVITEHQSMLDQIFSSQQGQRNTMAASVSDLN